MRARLVKPAALALAAALSACSGADERPRLAESLQGKPRTAVIDRLGRPCWRAPRRHDGAPGRVLGYDCIRGQPTLHVVLTRDAVRRVYVTR